MFAKKSEITRDFADDEMLRAYKIERVDDPTEIAALPVLARSLARDRWAYRVHNLIKNVKVPVPVYVFMERVVPKHQVAYNREQIGYAREGNLREALGMGHLWIIMAPVGDETANLALVPRLSPPPTATP